MNPLPFVKDVETSKQFYGGILGLRILEDHGNFVMFESGFAIHDGTSLFRTVFGADDPSSDYYGRANIVLYFEDADLDETYARVSGKIDLIHEIREETWGQRVFRFFDPDRHIVELGEPQ